MMGRLLDSARAFSVDLSSSTATSLFASSHIREVPNFKRVKMTCKKELIRSFPAVANFVVTTL